MLVITDTPKIIRQRYTMYTCRMCGTKYVFRGVDDEGGALKEFEHKDFAKDLTEFNDYCKVCGGRLTQDATLPHGEYVKIMNRIFDNYAPWLKKEEVFKEIFILAKED